MSVDNKHKIPELYEAIIKSTENIRPQSIQKYLKLWDAHIIMGDIVSALTDQGTENPQQVSEDASQRISLTANLLQSVVIVEQIISAGYYWSATALLRQHMEGLARIIQIRNGEDIKNKRPPNVKSLPFRLPKNYGRLSQLVHVSNGELLRDFAISSQGDEFATPFPIYREDWSRDLLSVHIGHMMVLTFEMHYLHQELYPDKTLIDVENKLKDVVDILVEEGFWQKLENKNQG